MAAAMDMRFLKTRIASCGLVNSESDVARPFDWRGKDRCQDGCP
jgi:hypothetical protein